MTANDELIVSLALPGPPPFPFGALVRWLHRRRALRKYRAFYNAAFGNDLRKTLAALLLMETEQQIAKAAWLAHQPSQRTDFFMAYEALLLGVVLRGRDEVATSASGRIANEIVASLCKLALFPETRFAEVRAAIEQEFDSLFAPGQQTGIPSPWTRAVESCREAGISLPFITDLAFQMHFLQTCLRLKTAARDLAASKTAA